ncbi:MAG: MFS transporter [Rhodocyclaceae bacterium]|nr:MFS transporter [Rhodocyclaceae bacterium]
MSLTAVDLMMTRDEKRAGAVLASIFALRMLGLFLILPVFSIYATTLPGGEDIFLVGLALGAYGLTQAFLHIPFGFASDRLGRKPVITAGLLIFAAGSFLAAAAPDIHWVIAGRVVQGAGAVSAVVMALAADLVRETHRTKVMAMIGASIGLVFALSLMVAPPLYAAIGMEGIFTLTGLLALGAIVLLFKGMPDVPTATQRVAVQRVPFSVVLGDNSLLRMNFGVLVLHMMQTALWVVVPLALVKTANFPAASHWKIYLPAVLASFIFMVPALLFAERRQQIKPVLLAAILLMIASQAVFWWIGHDALSIGVGLLLFFVAFNILEALQPSLVSRMAPASARGAAMGVYNTTQSMGLFLGGALGGLLLKYVGSNGVYGFSMVMGTLWFLSTIGLSFKGEKNGITQ